ncbi:MAG: hypothetical protein HRT35_23845 [Algicola sp.]|nr:hypothetical protein [Algicola sp.]
MIEKITDVLKNLPVQEQQRFYVGLANNLTLIIRGIWSDDSYIDANKLGMIKIVNECHHRILNHALSLYDGESTWTDTQVFAKVKELISKDNILAGEVGGALKLTMKHNKNFESL